MKIILKEDIETIGRKGEIKDVADGYARNYLFPRSLAVFASQGNIKNLEHFRAAAEKKREIEREEAKTVAEKIEALEIVIQARAGKENKLFGSVTSKHIADFIEKELAVKMDKKKIGMPKDIKILGKHKVRIHVYPEVFVDKDIEVIASEKKEPKKEEKVKETKAKSKSLSKETKE